MNNQSMVSLVTAKRMAETEIDYWRREAEMLLIQVEKVKELAQNQDAKISELRDVLDGIREAMETRGYAHMANGRSIGWLLDHLDAYETGDLV